MEKHSHHHLEAAHVKTTELEMIKALNAPCHVEDCCESPVIMKTGLPAV